MDRKESNTYISAPEAAMLWGVSQRRVNRLCQDGRIEGAFKVGQNWIIPPTTQKPADKRRKELKERGQSNGKRTYEP